MKHVTMELGGKSPLIIFDDADLEDAVASLQDGDKLDALDAQDVAAESLEEVNKRGVKSFQPGPEGEAEWVKTVLAPNMMTDYLAQCTPGYYNNEGKSGQGEGFFEGHYPDGAVQFFQMLEQWREEGQLRGLDIDN